MSPFLLTIDLLSLTSVCLSVSAVFFSFKSTEASKGAASVGHEICSVACRVVLILHFLWDFYSPQWHLSRYHTFWWVVYELQQVLTLVCPFFWCNHGSLLSAQHKTWWQGASRDAYICAGIKNGMDTSFEQCLDEGDSTKALVQHAVATQDLVISKLWPETELIKFSRTI